jgi:hypothetical protein
MPLHETVLYVDGVEIYRHSVESGQQIPPTEYEEIEMKTVRSDMNIRPFPNLSQLFNPPKVWSFGAVKRVYSVVVDEAMLDYLGLNTVLNDEYVWRYIPEEQGFVAERTTAGDIVYLKKL